MRAALTDADTLRLANRSDSPLQAARLQMSDLSLAFMTYMSIYNQGHDSEFEPWPASHAGANRS
ncbi:hypothetical protein CK222_29185 [Mesorhizobium sp. WSM3866]|nr:hypothetical protein CK222_29185 [Mesorhizobium sp. WSM3866]